ncbi:MAG: pilus assembly protein PilM [Planctomycetota bacterium]
MAKTATGIDVGTSTAKVLRGHVKGNSFLVDGFAVAPNPSGDIDGGWGALELGFKPNNARVGVTGREVNIRYTRVPRVPDWQLRKLMRFETEEIASQADAGVASDFNVLPEIPEIEGEDVVLLAMARESLLEDHLDGLDASGGKIDAFTPNAIGLYNAWLHYGVLMEDTVLVANIGHENVDVIVCRGSDLLFARNLTGGSKLFDDALVERFGLTPQKAEEVKANMVSLEQGATFSDPTAEKASRALMGPAGQILSLIQSTVLFCKSQVKLSNLKLDRVMICGGGAALTGLDAYLRAGLGVSVEMFDPFQVVDTSGLDPESNDALEEHRMEAVVALGLAHAGSDPEAYSIEILPQSIQKRRDFLQGTAFLIAAAVLAVAFLGLYGWKSQGNLASITSTVSKLRSNVNRVLGVDQDTRGLVEENRELFGYVGRLHATVGSGEQFYRVLQAVDESLPRDFWIEQLTSTWGDDDDWGIARGEEIPILRIQGRAREGTETPTVQFEEFVRQLNEKLPGIRMKEQLGATGSQFTIAMTTLAPAPETPDAELDDMEEEEG